MPAITRDRPVAAPASNGHAAALATGGVLGTSVSAASLKRGPMKVCLYGRNRVGKSRLSAEWPKPLFAIACEPRENGGADTLRGMEGVTVCEVGLKPTVKDLELSARTGRPPLSGSAKVLSLYEELAISNPFKTITVDVTALQDIILAEIKGWDSVDVLIKIGKKGSSDRVVSRADYELRAVKLTECMRKLKDLSCDVLFIGQEKDHNPPKDEDGNPVGSKLVSSSAQEKSFFFITLGEGPSKWLYNACPYTLQLYMDSEVAEHTTMVDVAGTMTPQTIHAQTGKFVRRLRCSYHTNYGAGITVPGLTSPDYIESNDPKEMYDNLMMVVDGKRAPKGKYL